MRTWCKKLKMHIHDAWNYPKRSVLFIYWSNTTWEPYFEVNQTSLSSSELNLNSWAEKTALCWLSLYLSRQWSTCVMRFDRGEQRARWMITPPNHTLTVTMGWPQLTLWPFNSLTSHWLRLNSFLPTGFYDSEREEKLLHCNLLAAPYRLSRNNWFWNVLQLKETHNTL